jgi:hypothetical protein
MLTLETVLTTLLGQTSWRVEDCHSRMVTQGLLLRISIVWLQLRWSRRKNPQRISEDTLPVFSLAPPCFVKVLKMLTTEPSFTTLLVAIKRAPSY